MSKASQETNTRIAKEIALKIQKCLDTDYKLYDRITLNKGTVAELCRIIKRLK